MSLLKTLLKKGFGIWIYWRSLVIKRKKVFNVCFQFYSFFFIVLLRCLWYNKFANIKNSPNYPLYLMMLGIIMQLRKINIKIRFIVQSHVTNRNLAHRCMHWHWDEPMSVCLSLAVRVSCCCTLCLRLSKRSRLSPIGKW